MTQKTKALLTTEITTNFPDNTVGSITPAIQRTTTQDFVDSWQEAPTINRQTGVSYAFVADDNARLVTFNNGGAVAVTLPVASSFVGGWNVWVKNLGVGTVTITPTTSTIQGNANLAVAQNKSIWIISDGTNYEIWPAAVI